MMMIKADLETLRGQRNKGEHLKKEGGQSGAEKTRKRWLENVDLTLNLMD